MNAERLHISQEKQLKIETVPQAASALVSVHRELKTQAVSLTDAYLERRCLGAEGTTWKWGNLGGQGKEKVPFLDPVLALNGRIILGGAFDIETGKLVTPYTLKTEKDPEAGIIVESTGWSKDAGYDKPPKAYIVKSSEILVVDTLTTEPDDRGKYPWGRLDYEQATPLTNITDDLLQTIEDVTKYKKI